MNKEWTEEDMRQALFGNAEISAPVSTSLVEEIQPDVAAVPVSKVAKKKVSKAFTPRLLVTLRVSNEFEGRMLEIVHEADTLSTLVAEQEATKAARKKFRYVEVVSVKSM
ncbi:hypothetical protein BLL37_05610 [Pseudomonas azotoformans]|uniref:Uncharacterized protein n=1 Tax=Pseudomonas azotoformans TaxID=47878 RepID=A0A1V2JUP3_PSEAZ|nr:MULTISPECIES: hypothetical protein [Pseudomonas]MCS4249466.1 hypothetical protein [Pseudomonas sp. BIGb0164]OIN52486.1 hypothetical protein BFL39_04190 [Pseudomonas azotoformans]ONH48835.1 hypothetical protein BLL37_05610 [Pseudomonas azotoformans]SDN54703.1 hypothetical protein SAMN04489799_2238 [Pseudomonas azotoformans]